MRLRLWVTLVTAFIASATVLSRRPDAQEPFRARVDVLTLDVTVLNRDGVPVEDLRPDDFLVKVGGDTRRVLSARLVTARRGDEAVVLPPRYFSTNATPLTGRKVMFAVDQLRLAPGLVARLLDAARTFLDGLAPADLAAFTAFPPPGPTIPFTLDKARVRAALRMDLGHPQTTVPSDFHVTLTEAVRISDAEMSNGPGEPGPVTRRVIEREGCPEGMTPAECVMRIKNEANRTAQMARTEGRLSIAQIESLLDQLAVVEGPKTLVLVSAGMFAEDPNALRELVRRAARARTTIHVVSVEPPLAGADGGDSGPTAATLADRQLELEGLQEAAAGTGGGFYRPFGNGAEVFQRIASEISASYELAVEVRADDRTRDRVSVDVRRKGLTVRASTALANARPEDARTVDQNLSDLLSSSLPVAGIPLRAATFVARDAASGKFRVTVAADIGQAGAPQTEYGVGYILTDANGRIVARAGKFETLTATAREPARHDGTLAVDPGTYTLRFGIVDRAGNRGSIVRELQVGPPGGAGVDASDLFVGSVSAAAFRPAVEPRILAGEVGLYVEFYPAAADEEWSVVFDVGEGEFSPALATVPADLGTHATAPWRIARARIDTLLAPGRYVARARVRRGGTTVATVARPFVLERNPARPADTTEVSRAGHPDLPRRTAAYVNGFVLGLSNVVAQEDFTLRRRVRSDFLLVRYPGSLNDLLAYRDVYQVDGNMLPGREQRLADLFIKPIGGVRDRVRQIQLDGEEYVPPMFNPLFAVSFLQGQYHQQFQFSVADADAPWPDGVRAVTFVETGRPTLLRGGANGSLDVPTRGIAWIEEASGRVLQTELEIGVGRSRPIVVTTFKLDERLQLMVPDRMETRNPDGLATYSNFRRFSVSTDAREVNP